ncbi:hypothetical protein GCL60_05440 [Silvanigrella paludirubra]|uniref:Lipoprotein n=1 Tax=Silvanigrella paludirubra TaxID=2499159 RepID=A0A6N6VTP2_9BACT|nr:hypothetical protein [Silvanigrella paludirubra]KAB8039705.1 hypothetical protein GCL60_05440 [Silvanigrella paludirubra]
MKFFIHIQFISIFLLFSCGKGPTGVGSAPASSNDAKQGLISNDMKALNLKIDDRYDSVGKGFDSITGLTAERCLENDSVNFVLEPTSNVTYDENLNSEQLLSKLGIGINSNIPLEVSGIPLTLSPEVQFSKESSFSILSKTATITIEIVKGYNQLVKKDTKFEYSLKDVHYKNLKENNSSFFNICGDEIVTKQNVKAQLLITAKFIYSDAKTKKDFETAMGVSIPNPFSFGNNKIKNETATVENASPSILSVGTQTESPKSGSKLNSVILFLKNTLSGLLKGAEGMSPGIKVKLNLVNKETLQNVSIAIKAIQLGGNPNKLNGIINSSCRLSEPSSCDIIFKNIQKYAANDFPDQLNETIDSNDVNSNKKFYYGEYQTSLYSNIVILGPNKKNISNDILKYSDGSLNFTNFKLKVRQDIRTSFQNYLRGKDIQNSKTFNILANDEQALVKSTIELSENNLYGLFRFIANCYNNINVCQNDYELNKKMFYKDYDKNFDDIRAWNLLASVQANWQPIRYVLGVFNSDRITEDFFMTSNFKGYNSFFIKYLDKNRNKVLSEKYGGISLASSYRCHDWLSDALGKVWLHEVTPNIVIPISDAITNVCGSKATFACTHNSDLEKIGPFYLEIWAQ